MRIALFIGCLITAQFLLSIPSLALDVIHFKDGRTLNCAVEAVTDQIVTFTYRQGQSVAKRSIGMEIVDFVDYGFEPGEEELFLNREAASSEILRAKWNETFGQLHRPRSRTGKWGLAYAYSLLRAEEEYGHKIALGLFERISEKAWSSKDRTRAIEGRLQALIRLGELEKAREESARLALETEDPAILIEVRYLQARAELAQLVKLEAENPKWEEDDEVRPIRNHLYHTTLDQFLWPFLFHGTNEAKAARGLFAAAEVYKFGGENEKAASCLQDVENLYPNFNESPPSVFPEANASPSESPDKEKE